MADQLRRAGRFRRRTLGWFIILTVTSALLCYVFSKVTVGKNKHSDQPPPFAARAIGRDGVGEQWRYQSVTDRRRRTALFDSSRNAVLIIPKRSALLNWSMHPRGAGIEIVVVDRPASKVNELRDSFIVLRPDGNVLQSPLAAGAAAKFEARASKHSEPFDDFCDWLTREQAVVLSRELLEALE